MPILSIQHCTSRNDSQCRVVFCHKITEPSGQNRCISVLTPSIACLLMNWLISWLICTYSAISVLSTNYRALYHSLQFPFHNVLFGCVYCGWNGTMSCSNYSTVGQILPTNLNPKREIPQIRNHDSGRTAAFVTPLLSQSVHANFGWSKITEAFISLIIHSVIFLCIPTSQNAILLLI